MPLLSDLGTALWLLTIVGGALAAARLYLNGLHRVYRYFFAYLALRTLRSGALFSFRPGRTVYGWVWALTEPLVWVLYVLIVLELCTLIFRDLPGIRSLSRWVITGGLLLALFVSALSFLPRWMAANDPYPVLLYYTMVERGVVFALVVFLLVIIAFLASYPLPVNRNTVAHAVLFVVFFISSTAALLVRNITGSPVNSTTNTALLAVSSACVAGWLLLLSPAGEQRRVPLARFWSADSEERLLAQLKALNRTLDRSSDTLRNSPKGPDL